MLDHARHSGVETGTPSGTTPMPTEDVSFVFADIGVATRIAPSSSPDGWAAALQRDDQLIDPATTADRLMTDGLTLNADTAIEPALRGSIFVDTVLSTVAPADRLL